MTDYYIEEYWKPPYPTTCSSKDMYVEIDIGNASATTGTHRVKSQEKTLPAIGDDTITPYGSPRKYTWTGDISYTNGTVIYFILRTTLQPTAQLASTAVGGWNPASDTVKWKIKIVTPDYVGDENGAPTYLETLDKLDQWTSAHYVPSPAGARDGKRRNELNL